MDTGQLSASLFAAFAENDLVRWRVLRGRAVAPRDVRWGAGTVIDARWESRSNAPDGPGSVMLRLEYAHGLQAQVSARAFARLHEWVDVDARCAEAVRRWYRDPGACDDAERELALARLDAELRAEQDDERARRGAELRARALGRRLG